MKDDHVAVLLEDIQSQIQRLAEAMADVPGDVRQLKEDVTQLKSDMDVLKAALMATNKQVTEHEERITVLEPS